MCGRGAGYTKMISSFQRCPAIRHEKTSRSVVIILQFKMYRIFNCIHLSKPFFFLSFLTKLNPDIFFVSISSRTAKVLRTTSGCFRCIASTNVFFSFLSGLVDGIKCGFYHIFFFNPAILSAMIFG